jgi:hypothetical protein
MALSMPITKSNLPTAARAQPNGAIPRHLLAQVDERTEMPYLMWASVATQMRAWHFAARVEAGIQLETTGRYRDLWTQYRVFCGDQRRYEPCSYAQYLVAQTGRRGKVWNAPDRATVASRLAALGHPVNIPNSTYWRKIQYATGGYPATAAVPGTSDHGDGGADDLAEEYDGDKPVEGLRSSTLQYLYATGARFGFGWAMKSEPWHVHSIAGNTTPAEVLRYLAVIGMPTLSKGATGFNVVWLQAQLNNHGHKLVVDGQFGNATLSAVLWQQGVWNQPKTGVVNADLWWMLGKAA